MALYRNKLRDVLAGLRASGTGEDDLYRVYLDRLPGLFGSAKLADEADLILAALTAAEQAYAEAASATAPVDFEPAGRDENGEALFRPAKWAPVGGIPSDWQGVPLYALASALDRARERESVDDEVYSASFVYVLFRLKAALGVWRAEAAPDARYRLWLRDLGPVIAKHPRLGPKVTACHGRIAEALLEVSEAYLVGREKGDGARPSPVFLAFGLAGAGHARAAGWQEGAPTLSRALWGFGLDLMQQGRDGRAVAWFSAQAAGLANFRAWQVAPCNDLATAYMNRGNAKQSAEGYGPGKAVLDYDAAIEIREALRRQLEPESAWTPELRNDLAKAYGNRGNAKQSAEGYGPGAAVLDCDAAIKIMEALRRQLEPEGAWTPALRNDLASAYINRGVAKYSAEGRGPSEAVLDFDAAIAIMEALRGQLEPEGAWNPELRNDLATAYMNRGGAKRSAEWYGPGAAVLDYDAAINIMEALRRQLEREGAWIPELRNDLAVAYYNRGTTGEDLQDTRACSDAQAAQRIAGRLVEQYGSDALPFWRQVAAAATDLAARTCGGPSGVQELSVETMGSGIDDA